MGLVGLVIRVLPHDDHLDIGDGSHLEGVKDVFLLGINLNDGMLTFLPD
jgi:hypothetical protein